ncbi:MAG: DUF4244 domain-containing protein [Acidobacteria bacterium]|nr:MAG: DUF4244 domain-containing protein [Acidobacteriota bacterium]TDI52083.1 MAG: DUF4244 domain-containing protein [Acidobacteriota bacterium]
MEGVSMTRLWIRLLAGGNDESGQATVEYFLVILAASALAIIALKWFQSGSGGGLLGSLFGRVIGWVVGRF